MTTSKTIHHIAFLLIAAVMVGFSSVEASEISGVLSSKASSNQSSSGSIDGTVSSEAVDTSLEGTVVGSSSSGSGEGSSGGGGGSALSPAPTGAVLGETIELTNTPRFPNAGLAPSASATTPTLWSIMITFIKNLVSF